MGGPKYNRRKERRASHMAMDEVMAAENQAIDTGHQASYYSKAWEAEKLIAQTHKQRADKWKSKALTFALMFWGTFAGLILYVMYIQATGGM